MRVRAQRTHFTGASNRHDETSNNTVNNKTQNVFERSFNKSKSLYAHSLCDIEGSAKNEKTMRTNPFLGTHNELETQRFDKNSFKPYKYQKMNFPVGRKTITFAPLLNNDVRQIQEQFKDKKINMHKLQQLKQAFVKNNIEKRNLQAYFDQFANNGRLGSKGLQKLVKEYGFDINEDEANLIFRLTQKANNSKDNANNELGIDGFVELMTKDDIYYKTMLLSQSKVNQQMDQYHFSEKVHEILRNKFPKLKQALKIYKLRNEEVGLKEFEYVMKKLDLTDLVMTKDERDSIFRNYSNEKGQLNVEGLICAIAEQEHKIRQKNNIFRQSDFVDDLKANNEIDFAHGLKKRHYDMKNLSNLQYEKQFEKARAIIEELKKLGKKVKSSDEIFKKYVNGDVISQSEVISNAEKIFKKEGINFRKDQYEAFGAYMNYDINGKITLSNLNQEIFDQTEKQARDRIERRVRNQAPKVNNNHSTFFEPDITAAIQTIGKIKAHRMNPETREFFKYLDEDQDGYINVEEFKQKIGVLNIAEKWEIQNLANHLRINEHGSINYTDFSKSINQDLKVVEKDLPFVKSRNSRSCYDWSQTTMIKNNQIKASNQSQYQRPSKFSAWPSHVTHPNLSLLQAPPMAGTFISESERFSDRKEDYGMIEKMKSMAVKEGRIQKIADWNRKLEAKAQANLEKEEQRMAARNYVLRLTKEKYQFNCHQ